MDVGVVGVGNMGKNHVRVYSELKGIGEVYVYDVDKKRIEEIEKEYEVKACASYEELLKNSEAVSIVVPTPYHYKCAKEAIEKGVNTLIEKPITQNIEEAYKIKELVEKNKVIVGVGHIERFNPVVKELKKIVERPIYSFLKRHNPSSKRMKGSLVKDLMIHDIDIALHILEEDEYVVFSRYERDFAVSMIGKSLLSASRASSIKERTITIEEEEKTIRADLIRQEMEIYYRPDTYESKRNEFKQENIVEKLIISKKEPLREELKSFTECVKKGKEFEVSVEQAIKNLEIAEIIEGKNEG